MYCKCSQIPFIICWNCEKKFNKYLLAREIAKKKINQKNKESGICKCINLSSYIIYDCENCSRDVKKWYENDYLNHK